MLGVHGGTLVPQTFAVPPPPQTWPGTVQSPQLMIPPQPSPTLPQLAPREAHVAGVHVATPPQTFGLPLPPQTSPAVVQVPHVRMPPQPSPAEPQS